MAKVRKANTVDELAPELTPAVEVNEIDANVVDTTVEETVEEVVKVEETPTKTAEEVKPTKVNTKKKAVATTKAKVQSLTDFLY